MGKKGGADEIKKTPVELMNETISSEQMEMSNSRLPGVRAKYKDLATRDMSQQLGDMASVDAQMANQATPIVNGRPNVMASHGNAMANAGGAGLGVVNAEAMGKDRAIKGHQSLMDSANKQSIDNLGNLGDMAKMSQSAAMNSANTQQQLAADQSKAWMGLGQAGVGAYQTKQYMNALKTRGINPLEYAP
jgi:hypothetical protein